MEQIKFSAEELSDLELAMVCYLDQEAEQIVDWDKVPEDMMDKHNMGEMSALTICEAGYRKPNSDKTWDYISDKYKLFEKIANYNYQLYKNSVPDRYVGE